MSETKEPELLACPFCGRRGELFKSIELVRCEGCHGTEVSLRDWNRRVPSPSAQWTAEPPKEGGWYLYWHMNSVKTMLVKNTEVISSYYFTIPQVERFFKHNQTMLFCRIPIPPLPERKESDE